RPAEALSFPSFHHVAPNLLLHPVLNEAEALAGVSYRKVIHPPTQHRVDQIDHPIHRLGLVATDDDLVILIDGHRRHDWLLPAVEKRLREELVALRVEVNEEKSRIVDLSRGKCFGYLGFDFRRIRSQRGVWCTHYAPKLKKRTALLRKL